MGLSWNADIPIVAIYNNLEVFHDFLDRTTDASVIHNRSYRGDRALLWLGADKLVVASAPVQHLDYLREQLGYRDTSYLVPHQPTELLSLDVIRETWLLDQIAEHAGPGRTLQLVPYATTPQLCQLADALRARHNLTVTLPESPTPENLWVRDTIDTKSGFRLLASQWLAGSAARIPFGIVCPNLQRAARAAHWFIREGKCCIVKADTGEGSLGHRVFHPDNFKLYAEIERALEEDSFLRDDLVVIEEYINVAGALSPSLELFVPPSGSGEPVITYLANQLFQQSGAFAGVLVSRELMKTPWYPVLRESGLIIASNLQRMGYVGHFDVDAVVDDQEQVYLLEVNARRTGGTHAHEFACFQLGDDYLDHVTLLSQNKMPCGATTRLEDLLSIVGDLQYPVNGEPRGIAITITSALEVSQFGCIIIADNTNKALTLQQELTERISAAERSGR